MVVGASVMGSHGIYVWSAYAVTLVALGAEVLLLVLRVRRASQQKPTGVPHAGPTAPDTAWS